ncbi:hypothetical protein MAPG_01706 [Magnaporthiopsis poae ATCC 64411]|uniref:Uncharacterized protein n=1 Tax=Magnaporthiopsis poae (strain ATCC 64411 / 73-15) TaxID=644358 RepID=A0A0C4DPE2_MAGP6|nr:hypothetical protein MAPG_01706 [Magnaporthiopsis poae ATCC 64411]
MQLLSNAEGRKSLFPKRPPHFHAIVAPRQSLASGPGPGPGSGAEGSAPGKGGGLLGLGRRASPRDEPTVAVASVSGGEIAASGCRERKCRGGRKGQDGDSFEDGGKMHISFFRRGMDGGRFLVGVEVGTERRKRRRGRKKTRKKKK